MTQVRQLFYAADSNSSGSLSYTELVAAIRTLDLELSEKDYVTLEVCLDGDTSGDISISELYQGIYKYRRLARQHGISTTAAAGKK